VNFKSYTAEETAALQHFMSDPTRNKTAAYRRAFDCSGMSEHQINCRASALFKRPHIATAVEHVTAQAIHKAELNAQYVAERLRLIADFNISKFMRLDERGAAYYDFSEATEDDWYCIAEYTVDSKALITPEGNAKGVVEKVKIKATSRLQALKLIGDLTSVQAFRENLGLTGGDAGDVKPKSFNDFYGEEASDDGES